MLLVSVDVEQRGKSFVDIDSIRAQHVEVTADEEPPAGTRAEGRKQVSKLVQEVGFRQSRWSINICDFNSNVANLQADELQLKRLGSEATLDWPGRQLVAVNERQAAASLWLPLYGRSLAVNVQN